ncbi:hypothetical protein FRB99_007447 [Tulasnella sp. 403]|nr:hypothetical protein FRB99_007447 [Tulasnella sp. 403]
MSQKQAIVVVGGGSSGVAVAKELSKKLDAANVSIQLVAARPFHIHWPAMLRTIAAPEQKLETLAWIPYDKLFQPGRPGEVIIGQAEQIEDGTVHLTDGRQLRYDWLVLSTGSKFPGPLAVPYDRQGAESFISEWRSKLVTAQNVVILGGGPSGLEMAGELRHWYPGKAVTVVHAQNAVLHDALPAKFRQQALDKARALGINVILNDRAAVPEGQYSSVTTEKGENIKADLVIPLFGGSPNTDFLRSFDPASMTTEGRIRVLPTFQVPLSNGKRNVYAVGDIIDWNEPKTLSKANAHAPIAAANIIAAVNGRQPTNQYKGAPEIMVVPFGPKFGVGYLGMLWGINMGDWMTSMAKGKTLLVEMSRKLLNVQ